MVEGDAGPLPVGSLLDGNGEYVLAFQIGAIFFLSPPFWKARSNR